jgi:hypothetical protein
MKLASQRDFLSGLLFAIVGLAFAMGATSHEVGAASRMGPGYFPLMLGVILALLGSAIIVKSFTAGGPDGDPVGAIAWRPLACVLGANLAFGALLVGLPSVGLPAMGLIVAIYALVIISGLGGENFKFRESMLLATILAVGSYLAFVLALKLQFPVWPAFLTR